MYGEQDLWKAVIMQAYQDMVSKTTIPKLIVQKYLATEWLTHPSKDLFTVCDYAGVHPDDIMRRASNAALQDGLNWRLPPGKRKDFEKQQRWRKNAKKRRLLRMGMPEPTGQEYHGSMLVDV